MIILCGQNQGVDKVSEDSSKALQQRYGKYSPFLSITTNNPNNFCKANSSFTKTGCHHSCSLSFSSRAFRRKLKTYNTKARQVNITPMPRTVSLVL